MKIVKIHTWATMLTHFVLEPLGLLNGVSYVTDLKGKVKRRKIHLSKTTSINFGYDYCYAL